MPSSSAIGLVRRSSRHDGNLILDARFVTCAPSRSTLSKHKITTAISFVTIGLFAATVGYSIGLDSELFRNVAAALMIAVGVVLLVPRFQERLALAGAPLANWSDHYFGATRQSGLGGQIAVGLLLGAVWSPCVGPTLGAASILAAQGRNLGEV